MAPAPRDVRPPTIPTGLRATASATQIELAWTESTDDVGVAGYAVIRGGRTLARVPGTTHSDSGLKPGTRACYSVRAYDAAGKHSPPSAEACAETRDETAPSVPGQLSVRVQAGSVAASWLASADEGGVAGYELYRGEARISMTVGTSALDPNPPAGREHCYRVLAFDHTGNRSPLSATACATIPDTTPPSMPARLAARAAGEAEVALAWQAATDEVGVVRYEVTRNGPGAQSVLVASSTELKDGGLAPATRACYQVRACDAAGNCSPASAEACATTPDLTPPTAPATSVRTSSDRAVEVHWSGAEDRVGVASYEVWRDGKALAKGVKETGYRDEAVRPGQRYCYTVRAADTAGNRSPASTEACATTPDATPPTAPSGLSVTFVSATRAYLAWDPADDDVGVTGYELLRGTDVVARATVTRAQLRDLRAGQEHCFAVRAMDSAGNRSAPSAPACAVAAAPQALTSPADLRAVRTSPTSVSLQWDAAEQAGVTYRVYARGLGAIGLTRGDGYVLSGLAGSRQGCFQVAAIDASGKELPATREVCVAAPVAGVASDPR